MRSQSPCKGCKERNVGCHSTCKEYQKSPKEKEAEKQMMHTYKLEGTQYSAFLKDQKTRRMREARRFS